MDTPVITGETRRASCDADALPDDRGAGSSNLVDTPDEMSCRFLIVGCPTAYRVSILRAGDCARSVGHAECVASAGAGRTLDILGASL